MDDTMQAGMSSVQSGLNAHLPLLHDTHHGTQGGLLLDLSTSPVYLDSNSLECSYNDGINAGPLFDRRKRSRSNSSRHRFNEVVTELSPEEVRWFYKEDKKTWKAFVGHDSLNIELMFRKYCELNPCSAGSQVSDREEEHGNNGVESRGLNGAIPGRTSSVDGGRGSQDTSTMYSDERDSDNIEVNVEPVCVRGGLYEVDVKEKECYPVYWKRKYTRLYFFLLCISHMTKGVRVHIIKFRCGLVYSAGYWLSAFRFMSHTQVWYLLSHYKHHPSTPPYTKHTSHFIHSVLTEFVLQFLLSLPVFSG